MKMKCTLSAEGNSRLAKFVKELPENFDNQGDTVFSGRNTVKIFHVDEQHVAVKSFKTPHLIQRLAYTFFRPSKAERAFRFAQRMRQLDIDTPAEMAFVELKKNGLFHRSYFVSEVNARPSLYDLLTRDDFDRDVAMQMVQFVALLHNKGVAHGDLNLSNILYEEQNGELHFSLIDCNRAHFGHLTEHERVADLVRITHNKQLMTFVAKEYARLIGSTSIEAKIMKHWQLFQRRYNIKERWKALRFCALLLTCLAFSMSVFAQKNLDLCSEKPRLVLIFLIDNLNNEQLDIVRSRCGRDGINRIFGQGTQLREAYYDAGGNFAGKNLASLFTGAPAATHGIVGEQWIDYFSNKKIHAAYGDAYTQSGHIDTLARPSNKMLLCSTIGNEIRKIYNDKAKIVSIGFDPDKLMWASGVGMAEPIAWFDTRTGTMQCRNMPQDSATWLSAFNDKHLADLYLDKFWAPKFDIVDYHEWRYFNQGAAQRTFYYPLTASPGLPKYARIVGSPQGNTFMRDFAVNVLLNTDMGRDDVPDVLTIQFSATPACGKKLQPIDAETEDLLLCLDDNIASILKVIDQFIGMDNTLVIFTSAQGGYDISNTTTPQWQSRGVVSLRRSTALLNLYLMALYGQGNWVRNYSSCAVYLDRKLCDEKKVVWDEIVSRSCDFLMQVQGIAQAIDARNLSSIYYDLPIAEALRRNYHAKRSGDILLWLEAGWAEETDDGRQMQQLWGREFVPLAFYGWKVPRAAIYDRHNMIDVAPTICTYIRTPLPNGCSGQPIPVVKKFSND